jgi:transglycosylase-like protein
MATRGRSREAATVPLPAGLAPGEVAAALPYQAPGGWAAPPEWLAAPLGPGAPLEPETALQPVGQQWWPSGRARPRRLRRTRRALRRVRRLVAVVLGLAVLGGLVFGGLLLVAPSVANAPSLARAIDRSHGVAYPGAPVPARFAAALTATEDHRFYSEPGIDPFAVGRVVLGRVTGKPDQGGATLYQQLAKMLYTGGRSGPLVETEQVLLGIKLDLAFSKAQIMRMYASVAYFGHGYYGLAQASCGYFGRPPALLSWAQAAMLAGLVQAPSADDPITNLANARARQSHVLGRLVATGALTRAQAIRAYSKVPHLAGGAGTGCTA